MPDPIDKLFKNAINLPADPLPVKQAEAKQPSTVSGIGEVKDGSGIPAQIRLHDKEIALIIGEDFLQPPEEEPSLVGVMFMVRVTQSGGSAGDGTTICTFTYEVRDLNGEILKDSVVTPLSPQHPRPLFGQMVAPATNAYGVAFYDETEQIFLWDVGEVPFVEVCVL